MSAYIFEKPLIRGTMIKRTSQFTALVEINGEELTAHIPTTNRIGDVENKNLPCLLSYHDDPKRKLKYDIEAVLLSDDENWVGINQILSNRLVEHFFNTHELDEIVSDFDSVQREVNLGISWADIVHIEDPFPLSVQVAKIAHKKGLPITGTYHLYPENMTASVPIFDFKLSNMNIMNVFRWGVYQYCRAIQCPTEKVRERLERCGYKSKLCVISNGIPPEFIADEPCTDKNRMFTIISVGRYSNEKDQKTLINAVGSCRYAADIQLILAGRGPLEEEYKKLGETLPNPPLMRFYDQDELRKEIRRADLYVHCANVEIEGMGCMEAFAQGTVPVIADSELSSTSVYALSENNKYEAGNPEDLVSKIEYWYEHRNRLYIVGCDYIALAKSLSITKSAQKLIQMMEESIGR